MEPRTGMSFATFDGAKAFVDNYAARFGFTIVLSNTNKSSDAQYLRASLICEKGGKYGGSKESHITKKVCWPFRWPDFFFMFFLPVSIPKQNVQKLALSSLRSFICFSSQMKLSNKMYNLH